MKTLNGFIQIAEVEEKGSIIMQDNKVIEVVAAAEDSEIKKGDKILYEGKKIEKSVDGNTIYFIAEDDVIAIL